MNIKNCIRRWLRMKMYKRFGDYCSTDFIDGAIDWIMSKPITGWPVAYQVVKIGGESSIPCLEIIYQWLRR